MKEERKKHDFFYMIWRYSLYYFNELYIKIEIEILDELYNEIVK